MSNTADTADIVNEKSMSYESVNVSDDDRPRLPLPSIGKWSLSKDEKHLFTCQPVADKDLNASGDQHKLYLSKGIDPVPAQKNNSVTVIKCDGYTRETNEKDPAGLRRQPEVKHKLLLSVVRIKRKWSALWMLLIVLCLSHPVGLAADKDNPSKDVVYNTTRHEFTVGDDVILTCYIIPHWMTVTFQRDGADIGDCFSPKEYCKHNRVSPNSHGNYTLIYGRYPRLVINNVTMDDNTATFTCLWKDIMKELSIRVKEKMIPLPKEESKTVPVVIIVVIVFLAIIAAAVIVLWYFKRELIPRPIAEFVRCVQTRMNISNDNGQKADPNESKEGLVN